MDFKEALTQKFGPLPVWAWGVLLGGAFVAFYWYSNMSAPVEPVEGDGTATPDTIDLPPSGDFSDVPDVGGQPIVDEPTNTEWLNQAIKAAASGGGSLVAVQRALEKYLSGQSLSVEEQGYVNRALQVVGAPPEGTSGVGELEPSPEEETRTEWNPRTKTTLKASSKRGFHTPVTVRVSVRWVEAQGRVIRPFGEVILRMDGRAHKRLRLVNGDAIYTMMLWRANKATADKRIVWTAKYRPTGKHTGGAISRPSAASPAVTQITN